MTSPAVSLRDPFAADKAARALSALLDLSKDLGPEFDLPKLLEVIAEKARVSGEDEAVVGALEQYDRSLRLAGEIQMRMLPAATVALPDDSPFAIRAFIRPAKQIGGDLYDFFWNDESLSFCIGDVTGKGVGAALVMAMTKTLLRAYSVFQYDPARLMSAVSARLSEETDPSMFVTAFCGLLDLRTGRFLYSNAGHEPPIVIRGGKPVDRLTSRAGIPLGALRSFKYVVDTRMLEPGDVVLLFTDGVTEAANRKGELFSFQRLREVVERSGAADPTSIVTDIVVAVDQFAEGTLQSDDIAMVCVQFRGASREAAAKFRRDVSELQKIFDFIGDFFAARGIHEAARRSVELAVEEIFMNYIRHNVAGKSDVEIRMTLDGEWLRIALTDFNAPAFDVKRAPQPDVAQPLSKRRPGGLGIALAK
ncbi:MAG TPA: SpoIIE family protein phosphatase, partial [Candidatus Tumulicola sp.]|nr:SpoIIE family protein phosphatase [Candidatus Tumulicola sp.]